MATNHALLLELNGYIRKERLVEAHLKARPSEWAFFQNEFDELVHTIGDRITAFEIGNQKDESVIYKFKRVFMKRLRKYFLHGEYVPWCLTKPYGYAGDFKIIDAIYCAKAKTEGFDRLFDEHFLNMHASIATRNRKGDFKQIILDKCKKPPYRIMNLASGPGRDIFELLMEQPLWAQSAMVDCFDFDQNAIDYAKDLLAQHGERVHFFQKNALRMALKKDIHQEIPYNYDVIYSTGLFDYLDAKLATRLISNLKKLLKPGGVLAISNYRDRHSNPSLYLMEWVAEWNLIYRTEDEFLRLFIEAGFKPEYLTLQFEEQKIMQYCLAVSHGD
jgi:SAM-dependent methyltransferase